MEEAQSKEAEEAAGDRCLPLQKADPSPPSADCAAGFGMTASPFCGQLLQLGVFGLGGDEDGDGGVGVFPQREEILIRGAGFGGVPL